MDELDSHLLPHFEAQTQATAAPGGQPLVSVLVPLYNHERYIVACLDSLVADGYQELEIVILDDGSRDESLRLALDWKERHSTVFSGNVVIASRDNRGITRTLNELIAMAHGEFIVLLASDDLLLPGGIRARLDYLQTHSEKMAVFADSVVIDKEGRCLHESALDYISRSAVNQYHGASIRSLLADDEMLSYELVFNWSVPGPGFMARREAYRILGGYDESLNVEDWDFYLRLTAHGLLGYLDRAVAAYRMHDLNSASSASSRLQQYKDLLRTATKNWPNFSGVKRFHLLALVLRFKALINRVEGHKFKAKFFHWGHKMLRWMTTRIYGFKVRNFCSPG